MHTISQLSRRYLRRQWKRTLFTGLGIVMATALFAGITLLFTSFVGMLTTDEMMAAGTWHYHVSGLTSEQASRLQANSGLKTSERIANSIYLGYFPDDDQPADAVRTDYLLLRDVSNLGAALTPFGVGLISGRLPQTANEIALNSASAGFFFPDAQIGDQVTMPLVDQRQSLAEPILTRTYTLVGLVSWADTNLPGPLFYALSVVPEPEKYQVEVYLTIKGRANYENQLGQALRDAFPGQDISGALARINNTPASIAGFHLLQIQNHDALLRYLGQSSSADTNRELQVFFGLLILIIMVSVIFVIRNSFAMSVNERVAEFGLLRIVGGSPGQIRRLVLQDALQLALISIPVGLLAGLAAMQITLSFVSRIDLPMIRYLQLIVSPVPLLAAAVLSLLAITLAALSPAIKAGRRSPIEAIRRSDAYANRADRGQSLRRKGKISRLLFGPAGILASRNVRRDKRRFRNTALSVAISVILFLAAGGISLQFSREMAAFNTETVDFRISGTPKTDFAGRPDLDAITKAMTDNPQVKQAAAFGSLNRTLQATADQFSAELVAAMQKVYTMDGAGMTESAIRTQLLQNAMPIRFILADRALLNSLGIADADAIWTSLQHGEAILCQKASLSLNGLGMATVPITTMQTGDTVYIAPDEAAKPTPITSPKQEAGAAALTDIPLSYKIAAEMAALPWFSEGFFSSSPSLILIVDRTYLQNHTTVGQPENRLRISENLAVDAFDDQAAEVQALLVRLIPDNPAANNSLYLLDNYARLQSTRNIILVINIFVFGFAIVIMLICSMNILNTVTTNVLLRRRELAMMQAVGMSRQQICQMLYIECACYGVTGAFWGSLIGMALLYLLGSSIDGTISGMALSSIPWPLIGLAMGGSLIIAILAGMLPVRRVMRDNIVEAIRAEE